MAEPISPIPQNQNVKRFPFETSEPVNIREILNPIILCLKVFGLYYDQWVEVTPNDMVTGFQHQAQSSNNINCVKPEGSSETYKPTLSSATTSRTCREGKMRYLAQKCYCLFILLILCGNVVKYGVYVAFDDYYVVGLRVSGMVFFVQSALAAACIFTSCWFPGHFREFYKQWSELFKDPVAKSHGLVPTNCRRGIIMISCAALIISAANMAVISFSLFYDKVPFQRAVQESACAPFSVNKWSLAIAIFFQVVSTAAWFLPPTFVICLAYSIIVHYKRITLVIRTHIRQSEGKIPANLMELRKCHLKMCHILQVLNRFLRSFLVTLYVTNLVICCFILYQLVNSADITDTFSNIIWLIFDGGTVIVVSISLALLHEAAHAPLEDLFTIETEGANVSEALQLQLFLSKLTGTSIGATVLNLLVVTKEFLLTIVGVFITYFFLLIQFRI